MQGASGTYAVNNINLTLQPTSGKWIEPTSFGLDGGAHGVYSSFKSFELKWVLTSTNDAHQIIDFYNQVSNTGTVVFCLPKWNDPEYTFFNYSGTVPQHPTVNEYFMGHIQEMIMLILAIRTD